MRPMSVGQEKVLIDKKMRARSGHAGPPDTRLLARTTQHPAPNEGPAINPPASHISTSIPVSFKPPSVEYNVLFIYVLPCV